MQGVGHYGGSGACTTECYETGEPFFSRTSDEWTGSWNGPGPHHWYAK